MASAPRTNPTSEQLAAMKSATDELVGKFTKPGLAAITGIERHTVQAWELRGRVSAAAANRICKIPMIRDAGFTREKLRPDVKIWIQDFE